MPLLSVLLPSNMLFVFGIIEEVVNFSVIPKEYIQTNFVEPLFGKPAAEGQAKDAESAEDAGDRGANGDVNEKAKDGDDKESTSADKEQAASQDKDSLFLKVF